jgi:Transposase IS116/IS110/IS902 family
VAGSLAAGAGIEQAELALREGLTQLGCQLLEPPLAADPGYAGPRAKCGAGHQGRFAGYRDKVVDTVLGPVRIRRAWYHCAQCGHGFAPRDAGLGVAGQGMSPGLRKMTARAAAAVPFAAAAKLVGELAGITLTGKRAGRRAEADGTAAARVIEAQAAAITARQVLPLPPAGTVPDLLYICVDGTGVPVIPAETEGRDGKGQDGKARTREVKLCCCFTQTSLDDKGRPVRDPRSSSYLATFAPAGRFGTLMAGEARRRGAGHIRQLVILGDSAAWIVAALVAQTAALRPRPGDVVGYATRVALRELGRRAQFLDGQLGRLDALIVPLVTARAPGLLALYGVGPHTAAMLLIAAGDHPGRLRSEAAWAHLCAAAPIPASSGKTVRHRLNPGGDRQANHALWRIVFTRMSSDPATRAYVERRSKEGLSKKEIIRCLKRYVAREVYPHLRAPAG